MKNKIIFSALLTLVFLVVLTSCKPKEDDPVVPATKTCRLASFRNILVPLFNTVEYSSDGKITKITYPSDSAYLTFTYKEDSIIEYITNYKVQDSHTGVLNRFKLNTDGNVVWISGANAFISTYLYNSDGYLQTYTQNATSGGGSNTYTYVYTVANGNYVTCQYTSTTGTSSLTTYYYDLTKENKETNLYDNDLGIANLRYGKKNKNVLTGYTRVQGANTEQVSYIYEYDSDGNLTKEIGTHIYNPGTTRTDTTLYTFKCE